MRKLICYLLDHKTSTDYNDSGYPICKRCESHSYYESFHYPNIWSRGGILKLPYRLLKGYYIKLKNNVKIIITEDDLPF